MSGWHCYMLECADGTLYTGITNDLEKRLAAHNSGTASKCTRSRLPVKLVFTEDMPDRAAASRREIEIKRLPRSAKLALLQCNGVLLEPENEVNLKNSVEPQRR